MASGAPPPRDSSDSGNGAIPFSEYGGLPGHRERMREELVHRKVDALADYELLGLKPSQSA